MEKRKKWTIIAIVALIVIVVGYVWNGYNAIVTSNQDVDAAWAKVEAQYQRRADLIPNLVAAVKGYASHEKETLAQVIKARSEMLAGTTDTKQYINNQQTITAGLGRLIALGEKYPDLKANQNFLELQAQLEGTENRITVARNDYNDAVKRYNVKCITFPSNLIAKLFGFDIRELFAAAKGAEKAPKVEF